MPSENYSLSSWHLIGGVKALLFEVSQSKLMLVPGTINSALAHLEVYLWADRIDLWHI